MKMRTAVIAILAASALCAGHAGAADGPRYFTLGHAAAAPDSRTPTATTSFCAITSQTTTR